MKLTDRQKGILVLAEAHGIGRIKGRKIIESLDVGALVHDVESYRYKITTLVGEKGFEEIKNAVKTLDFSKLESDLGKENAFIVTILDDEYSDAMVNYDDAPLYLYGKGDISLLKTPSFAIVGTRNPTKYGERVTEEFATALGKRFCIVSGMAKGVDGIAQRATLKSGGKTVAVLGCGVNVVYPSENRDLYEQIVKNGLVLSEYPLGQKAEQYNFPTRNRIISGLSRAVLVTEAGKKSGTLHTINHAIKQGKDVFCVPGSIYNKASEGCNYAIKECQTRIATCVNDIYDELGLPREEQMKEEKKVSDNEEIILNLLRQKGELHFEELLDNVEWSIQELNSLLVRMSASGLIVKTKNNFWSI